VASPTERPFGPRRFLGLGSSSTARPFGVPRKLRQKQSAQLYRLPGRQDTYALRLSDLSQPARKISLVEQHAALFGRDVACDRHDDPKLCAGQLE